MVIKEITPQEVWPVRQIVMWPDKPLDFIKIENDHEGGHYGLFQGEKLSSVVSCFEAEGELQFRKFATLKEEQGKGLGTLLLNFIFEVAREKGMKRVWCNARLDKSTFYKKFGLKATEERFVKDGVDFVIMECFLPSEE